MVNENWPTYLLLAVYILGMTIVTIVANKQNKTDESGDAESAVVGHFLASKSFGSAVLFFTTFASVFSCYTVMGVPNETGVFGFKAVRWVGVGIGISISMLLIFPRLRRLSIVRKYESPGDFIRDRFRSQSLSVLITLCLCVPQLLYIAVNIFSLGALLEALTNKQLSFYAVSFVSVFLILVFEALGGFRSVAYTDVIQASVMIIVFIIMPLIILVKWGGFAGMVSTGTCSNSRMTSQNTLTGCLSYVQGGIRGANTVPDFFLRMPSSLTTINYLLFMFSLISFGLNPHILQRAFTAKDDASLKLAVSILFLAPLVVMVPGILTGIAFLSNKSDFPASVKSIQPFMAILTVFKKDSSGFVQLISYVALLAGVSGIMSTADSSLIGVSNTVSVNIFKNLLTPEFTPHQIVYAGKGVSVVTMIIATGIAIHLYVTGIQYGVMLTLQQAILWQAVPAYLLGLYSSISHEPILFGLSLGMFVDIILIGLVFADNGGRTDPLAAADQSLGALDKSWSSLIGVAVNVLACAIAHWGFRWGQGKSNFRTLQMQAPLLDEDVSTPKKDDPTDGISFANKPMLTHDTIQTIMKDIDEPVTKYSGAAIWAVLLFGIIPVFHMVSTPDPALVKQYGMNTVRKFAYNGKVAPIVGGLPSWVLATLIWLILAALSGLYAASLWSTDETPVKLPAVLDMNEKEVELGGV